MHEAGQRRERVLVDQGVRACACVSCVREEDQGRERVPADKGVRLTAKVLVCVRRTTEVNAYVDLGAGAGWPQSLS